MSDLRDFLRDTLGELPPPQPCDRCGAQPGVIVLTAVRGGGVTQERLCARCAHAEGIDGWSPHGGYDWDTTGEPWHVPEGERWARWVDDAQARVARLRTDGTPEDRRGYADWLAGVRRGAEGRYGPFPPDLAAFVAEFSRHGSGRGRPPT